MYVIGAKSAESIDPKILIRAAQFYLKQFDAHLKGTEHLSKETIKYSTEHLLEMTLMLEVLCNLMYESLPEEIKKQLRQQELKRNEHLFTDTRGGALANKDVDTIKSALKSYENHYDEIRAEANIKTSGEC